MAPGDGSPLTYEYEIEGNESPSAAVVMAVHTVTGQPVEEIPTLRNRLSPDALDELCESLAARSDDSDGRVTFRYCGFTVTVAETDTVLLNVD